MADTTPVPDVDREELREAIRCEYREVARAPGKGFHFHTGRKLTEIVGYRDEWLIGIPEIAIESFAGTGNPFSIELLRQGEKVLDLGCGAGIDSLIAARQVGDKGAVIGIDMTPDMLGKAKHACEELSLKHVEFRRGYLEDIPVDDAWADVVISNGTVNLCPDKRRVFSEIYRVLRPGGRIQIADIMVNKPVPQDAKKDIALWTG